MLILLIVWMLIVREMLKYIRVLEMENKFLKKYQYEL